MYKVITKELSRDQREYILNLPKNWQQFYVFFSFTHPFSHFRIYKHIIDKMFEINEWVDLRIRVLNSELPFLTPYNIGKAINIFTKRKEIVRLRIKEPFTSWWIGLPDVKTLYNNTILAVPFYNPKKPLLDLLDKISERAHKIIEKSDIFFLENLEKGLHDGES